MRSPYVLPPNLPVPQLDDATKHLMGMEIPSLSLPSTQSESVNLRILLTKPTILFIFPSVASEIQPSFDLESWNKIPGATGCTPQCCAFRDNFPAFGDLGVNVVGLSGQSQSDQIDFVQKNQIPFPLLSDHQFFFCDSLKLPTFVFEHKRFMKRMALFVDKGRIQNVFYPVYPADKNAETCLAWLKSK